MLHHYIDIKDLPSPFFFKKIPSHENEIGTTNFGHHIFLLKIGSKYRYYVINIEIIFLHY